MSQNKIFVYLRSTVLRVAYETREILEEITDVLTTQLADSLRRSTQNARAVVDQSTVTDDINYTVDLASGPPSGFYVDTNDPSASDSNPGTAALPWKTIQKATQTLTAGQTVYVRNGTYINNTGTSSNPGDLNPANSGTAGNPIAFRAYPGHTPLVQNTAGTSSGGEAVIGTNGRSYIIWDGFEVVSATPRGIVLWSSSNCIAERCNVHGIRGDNGNNADGVRIEGSTNCIVRNCLLHDCRNASDDPNGSALKIYSSNGIIAHNNEVYDCGSGLRDKTGGVNTTFYNNWIYDCTRYGLQSSRPGGLFYQNIIENCGSGVNLKNSGSPLIYNNAFVNISGRPLGNTTSDTDGEFYNNIMYNCSNVPDSGLVSYCDFNCYYLSSTGCGADITADPKFVSTSFSDPDHFKLQGGSPCAGVGRTGEDNIGAYPIGSETIGRE